MKTDGVGVESGVLAESGGFAARDASDLVASAQRLFGGECFTISDITQAGHPVLYASDAFLALTGYPEDEVLGRNLGFLQGEDHDQQAAAEARAALLEGRGVTTVLRNYRRDGTLFFNEQRHLPIAGLDGRPSHLLVLQREVTEAARDGARDVHHDSLTGLASRRLLEDRARQALFEAQREGGSVALVLFDLDHFDFLNETLGVHRADRVLRHVAGRLGAHLRRTDTLARLEGDVFAVLLTKLPHPRSALPALEKLQGAILDPVQERGATLRLSATVGVEVFPEGAQGVEALLAHAEQALAEAKAEDRGGYRFHAGSFDAAMRQRASMVRELRRAVLEDQLVLHYQPKVELESGAISSVEALVRWAHPERGLLKPAEFLPVVEEARLEVELFGWVLEGACRQAMRWQQQRTSRRVAINAGPQALEDPGLPARVKDALTRYDLHPGRLEIEINERVAPDVLESAVDRLRELRSIGVRVALDDFGVERGSLAQLRAMPLDGLKIDRSFVGRLGGQDGDEELELVRAMIGLGKSLHLRVTAEGIETRAQNAVLRTLACDDGQGFLFSQAVPAEYVPAFA